MGMHRGLPTVDRRFLLRSSAALALAGLPGRGARAATNTLVVGVQGLPGTLSTSVSSFAAENLSMQTMSPLVLRDDEGRFIPGLAQKWAPLDATTWQFDLRPGVTFHDGAPFTSKDVNFTLDYILAPKSLYGSKERITQVDGVEIAGDHAVRIHTKGPFP